MIHTSQLIECSALCSTCPELEEVARTLNPLGFLVAFQMKEQKAPIYAHLPVLPSQLHLRDSLGTEIIYLAGPDRPNVFLPPHASRFWIYGGSSLTEAHQAMDTLSHNWSPIWLDADAFDTSSA